MSTPFTLSLPRTVGDGPDMEVVTVPLEVRAYWFDNALHVISARVTDFVRLDNSFVVYRAGEPHAVGTPDDLARLEKECARMESDRQETAREYRTAMDDLEPFVMPDMPEFDAFPADEYDRQVREAA